MGNCEILCPSPECTLWSGHSFHVPQFWEVLKIIYLIISSSGLSVSLEFLLEGFLDSQYWSSSFLIISVLLFLPHHLFHSAFSVMSQNVSVTICIYTTYIPAKKFQEQTFSCLMGFFITTLVFRIKQRFLLFSVLSLFLSCSFLFDVDSLRYVNSWLYFHNILRGLNNFSGNSVSLHGHCEWIRLTVKSLGDRRIQYL